MAGKMKVDFIRKYRNDVVNSSELRNAAESEATERGELELEIAEVTHALETVPELEYFETGDDFRL